MAKILIVDDSGFSRRTLRKLLEAEQHLVVEAEDGMAALERYYLEAPDLVLLDMNMRGLHGLDVLRKLREIDPHARVVAATADVQSSTRTMAAEAGASGFLPKPFVADDVRAIVGSALAGDTP
jgi:two-component system chemotaxis response regulator CheY